MEGKKDNPLPVGEAGQRALSPAINILLNKQEGFENHPSTPSSAGSCLEFKNYKIKKEIDL